jgi:hypothetical protein
MRYFLINKPTQKEISLCRVYSPERKTLARSVGPCVMFVRMLLEGTGYKYFRLGFVSKTFREGKNKRKRLFGTYKCRALPKNVPPTHKKNNSRVKISLNNIAAK